VAPLAADDCALFMWAVNAGASRRSRSHQGLLGWEQASRLPSSGPIADPAAIEFTRGFYDAIGAGRNVPAAYEEGVSCAKLKRYSPSVILLRGGEDYSAP